MKNTIRVTLVINLLALMITPGWAERMGVINRAAWIPGTEKFLVVNARQKPLLWNSSSECPYYFYNAHKGDVIDVVVAGNGRLAITSSLDRKIKVWDVATGAEKHEISGFEYPSSAIVLSKDARRMVMGDWGGNIKQWSLTEFKEIWRFKAFDSEVSSIGYFYPKRLIIAGSSKGELLLWDMQQGEIALPRFKAFHGAAVVAKFTHDGNSVVALGNDGRLLVWDYTRTNEPKRYYELGLRETTMRSMDVSPDDQYILVGAENGMIYLVDLHTGHVDYQFNLSDSPLQYVKFRNEVEAILIDQSYRIWSFQLSTHQLKPVTEISREKIIPFSTETYKGHNWVEKQTGIALTWVEGGCFDIGCDPLGGAGGCASDNTPQQNVCLNGYWMSRDEITGRQWLQMMSSHLPIHSITIPLIHQIGDHEVAGKNSREIAVSGVSWWDAQNFVCALNRETGGDFRVPTEAEWEYACDNATETQERLGKTIKHINKSENHDDNQQVIDISSEFYKVKTLATPLDIRNMQTGASEWVLDIYNRFGYDYDVHFDPLYLKDTLYYFYNQAVSRVKRGGSWDIGRLSLGCVVRQFNDEQGGHDPKNGLRITIH